MPVYINSELVARRAPLKKSKSHFNLNIKSQLMQSIDGIVFCYNYLCLKEILGPFNPLLVNVNLGNIPIQFI